MVTMVNTALHINQCFLGSWPFPGTKNMYVNSYSFSVSIPSSISPSYTFSFKSTWLYVYILLLDCLLHVG
jgi:hypothetical protein